MRIFLITCWQLTKAPACLVSSPFEPSHRLKQFTNDIMWDEKIYGTLHIAFGKAYPQFGGENKSAIHWDVVKKMRNEGEVTIDGKSVMRDGKLLFDQI